MHGVDAVLAWTNAMITGDGDIQCGLTWDLQRGWRPAMRTGSKVLIQPARMMRRLGEQFRDNAESPPELQELGVTMIEVANEAKAKNERHEIPDGAVAWIPHGGRA